MMPTLLAVDLAGGVDSARVMLDGAAARPPGDLAGRAGDAGLPPGHEHPREPRPEDQAAIGITDGLLRISVGLEAPAELIADLCQAIPA